MCETDPVERMILRQTKNKMNTTELEFIVPPICQGQMVTYAYAVDTEVSSDSAACIIRRRSCGGEPTIYERFIDPEWADEYSTNLEFWNDEPKLGNLVETWTEE
jgi:hypothetical protein